MKRSRRLSRTSQFVSSVSLVACFWMSNGQSYSIDFARSKHGTLIEFARRDGRIAVAADSREVSVSNGTTREACKLRLPTSTTLLAITGHETLTPYDSEVELWNGLNQANEIFSPGGVESEQSIEQKETRWLNSLESVIATRRFIPRPQENGKIWVSLNIFTSISGKIRVFRIGLDAKDRIFSPFREEIPAPTDGQTQVRPFGTISMFEEASLVTRMTEAEQKRYRFLMGKQGLKAASVKELKELTLSLEALGSDIEARTATETRPASIAGPFSSATFDATEGHWLTYPAEPCAKFLKPAAPKKRTVRGRGTG